MGFGEPVALHGFVFCRASGRLIWPAARECHGAQGGEQGEPGKLWLIFASSNWMKFSHMVFWKKCVGAANKTPFFWFHVPYHPCM